MNPVSLNSQEHHTIQEKHSTVQESAKPDEQQSYLSRLSGCLYYPCAFLFNARKISERNITTTDAYAKIEQHVVDEIRTCLTPLYKGFSPETLKSIYTGEFTDWKNSEEKQLFDFWTDFDRRKSDFICEEISEYCRRYPKKLLPDACPLIAFSNGSHLPILFSRSEIANKKLIEIFSDKMMMSACDLNPVIDSGVGKLLPHDTPVNLIWVGSLIPDLYLENIALLASISNETETLLPAKREIILWKDRTLLTENEDSLMKCIPELPEAQGINIKVLDINDAGLERIFEGADQQEEYQAALQWLRGEHKNYAMYSDVIRYALLAAGADAIDQAEGKVTERTGKGMLYMDTDTLDGNKLKCFLKDGDKIRFDCKIELGFAFAHEYGRNDFLACNEARHPIALATLRWQVDNLNNVANRNRLMSLKEQNCSTQVTKDEWYIRAVKGISGPGCCLDSLCRLLLPDNATEKDYCIDHQSITTGMLCKLDISRKDGASCVNRSSDLTWCGGKPASFYEANWKKQFCSADYSKTPEDSGLCSLQ